MEILAEVVMGRHHNQETAHRFALSALWNLAFNERSKQVRVRSHCAFGVARVPGGAQFPLRWQSARAGPRSVRMPVRLFPHNGHGDTAVLNSVLILYGHTGAHTSL